MSEIVGQVRVSVSEDAECYGGRRIHLRVEGLPGWLLQLLFEGAPFVREASSSRSDRSDTSGPNSVLLGSTRVVQMAEPRPVPESPGAAPVEPESEQP